MTVRPPPDDHHAHKRVFVGPMPEKVILLAEARVKKIERARTLDSAFTWDEELGEEQVDRELLKAIKEHAFSFFIGQGGNVEDWGENTERGIRREMLQRWKESDWGRVLTRNKKQVSSTDQWVGTSFEIGNFLGVNVLVSIETSGGSTAKSPLPAHESTTVTNGTVTTPAGESFVTAPMSPGTPIGSYSSVSVDNIPEASSSTRLLLPNSTTKVRTDVIRRPTLKLPRISSSAKGDGIPRISRNKAKGKSVHYENGTRDESPAPVPVHEVLERTGSAVRDTSTGATRDTDLNRDFRWGDVVMRDRMLVRVSYTKAGTLGSSFDEAQNRTTTHLQYEDWAEFMIVWRKDQLEIYEDYSIPLKERFTGHKHLAFLVPLKAPKTRLSLYSFVDMTFCLTCPPTPVDTNGETKSRSIFHRSKEGTNIFVFKVKSRTRGLDWTWQLWRQLGGQIPSSIEVRSPSLDARLRIEIPPAEVVTSERGYSMFSRENIIELCSKSFAPIRDWQDLVRRQMEAGKELGLAWRMETKLDWVWMESDVDGTRREWAVLCGLALKQSGKSPHLEILLKEHFPATVHLPDDTQFREPPAIEGYVGRIKPNTQTKQAVYLATHDGNLFVLPPAHAHPPSPPGLNMNETIAALRESEVGRGAQQVVDASGVCDLRSIVAIRRAFQVVPPHMHSEHEGNVSNVYETWAQAESTGSDGEDGGGEEGVSRSGDKSKLKMMRSFELLLSSGHVVRFEAHSSHTALEWIERLRALIFYWKHRHRIDAHEEMELAQVGSRRPRLTPHKHIHCDDTETPPEPPADPNVTLPSLRTLYNWCVLEGCKPILKGGKIFARKGLHGQYELVQMFLVGGQLVQYHITPNSSLHHRRAKMICLLDAYICSGYFAALALPNGQYSSTAQNVPRRYQDGLEADDPEEDMLFMIWHRPPGKTADDGPAPPLSAKRKVVVFRTRSKMERDAWCWALNCEIEKVVREKRNREEKLRETGGLVKI